MAQCTATAHSTKERCKRRAVKGYTVCQVHGAGSPLQGRPGGAPRTAGGRYSKFLPQRMVGRYEEARQDPELRSFADDLALLDTRLSDLLSRVDTKEAGRHWFAANDLYKRAVFAARTEKMDEFNALFAQLGNEIGAGASDYAAWNEISDVLEQRRRLLETEGRMLDRLKLLVTIDEALQYIQAILAIVSRNVDAITFNKINARVLRFLEATGDSVISASFKE